MTLYHRITLFSKNIEFFEDLFLMLILTLSKLTSLCTWFSFTRSDFFPREIPPFSFRTLPPWTQSRRPRFLYLDGGRRDLFGSFFWACGFHLPESSVLIPALPHMLLAFPQTLFPPEPVTVYKIRALSLDLIFSRTSAHTEPTLAMYRNGFVGRLSHIPHPSPFFN